MPEALADDDIVTWLKQAGVEVTRQNYIDLAYGKDLQQWTVEDEMGLPVNLQDWSNFKLNEATGELEFTGDLVTPPGEIRTMMIDGRKAMVVFLDDQFEICDEADATMVKVIFADDGSVEFLAPRQVKQ